MSKFPHGDNKVSICLSSFLISTHSAYLRVFVQMTKCLTEGFSNSFYVINHWVHIMHRKYSILKPNREEVAIALSLGLLAFQT